MDSRNEGGARSRDDRRLSNRRTIVPIVHQHCGPEEIAKHIVRCERLRQLLSNGSHHIICIAIANTSIRPLLCHGGVQEAPAELLTKSSRAQSDRRGGSRPWG